MKTQMNLRSMLVAAALALALVFVLGSARSTNPALQARFQLALPGEGTNAYIIDTTTGQVWEKHPVGGDSATEFRKAKLESQ